MFGNSLIYIYVWQSPLSVEDVLSFNQTNANWSLVKVDLEWKPLSKSTVNRCLEQMHHHSSEDKTFLNLFACIFTSFPSADFARVINPLEHLL